MYELEDYELTRQIGSGSFSSVYLATHKLTGMAVAVKILARDGNHDQDFMNEIEIFQRVSHPFIARLFDVIKTETKIFLIMEYAEKGNLLELANSGHKFTEMKAAVVFAQLISALNYLHKHVHVAHRDIKAENLLFDRHGNLRLADFGLSCHIDNDCTKMSMGCGSPSYASPEMLKGREYTCSTDLWSAGVVLFALVAGYLPFDDDDPKVLTKKIIQNCPDYPESCSPLLVDLLSRLLWSDPYTRITLPEVMNHPWLRSAQKVFKYEQVVDIPECTKITKEMEIIGVSTSHLKQIIETNAFNSTIAVYQMLYRRELTDNMKFAFLPSPRRNSFSTLEPEETFYFFPENSEKQFSHEIATKAKILKPRKLKKSRRPSNVPRPDYRQSF